MQIALVRHGQSEHHVNGYTGGWTDFGLTELGYEQAERAAERLGRLGPWNLLLTSDLLRATQTATVIASHLGLELRPVEALREFNNGDAAGLTEDEARRRFPEAYSMDRDPATSPFPNSESWVSFFQRVRRAVGELTRVDARGLVAVTHGGFIWAAVSSWLRLEPVPAGDVAIHTSPGGIVMLETEADWHDRALRFVLD